MQCKEAGEKISAYLSSARPASVLAAHNPAERCAREAPRQRFLGYRFLATTILISHWPVPGSYLARALVPEVPPLLGKEGEERKNLAMAQLWAFPSIHGNPAIGTQHCIFLSHKGPQGPALSLHPRLPVTGMRSLPRRWPLGGLTLLAFQPLGRLRPSGGPPGTTSFRPES